MGKNKSGNVAYWIIDLLKSLPIINDTSIAVIQESLMQEKIQPIADADMIGQAGRNSFNYNKLQAVLCIAASALLSSALIAWAIRSFF